MQRCQMSVDIIKDKVVESTKTNKIKDEIKLWFF